ncbi:MAG: hypothetical protein SGBAC_006630, partial [Bacillariaceae sp.]
RIKVKKNSQRMSLAELRASAPPVTLPLPSPLLPDVTVGPSVPPQMSAMNAAQFMLLAQRENEQNQQRQQQQQQQQQQQIQCQNLIQSLGLFPNLAGRAQSHPSSLFNMSAASTHAKLTPSSALNSLLLNQLAQNQAQAPSMLVRNSAPRTSSPADLDRLKMQISLALLATNHPNGGNTMNSGMGATGFVPNEANSSK